MKQSLDDLVFNAIKREIEEIYPEEINGMTNEEIIDLINYIAEGFPDFIKDEIGYYHVDKDDDDPMARCNKD